MIQRVWQGARGAKSLERIIVATDDERIADACRSFGAEVALTRADHASGTDRIAEVAARLDCDAVVNVQGDEPLIEGFVIDAAVAALAEDPEAADRDARPRGRARRARRPEPREGRARSARPRALLLAQRDPVRARAASRRAAGSTSGLYAYRRDFLLRFPALSPTPAELRRGPRAAARARARLRDPLRGDRGLDERRRSTCPPTWRASRRASRCGRARERGARASGERLDARTVREWGQRYSNWGRFGREDELGTLNFITPARVLAAASLVRSGLVVSCAPPLADADARAARRALGAARARRLRRARLQRPRARRAARARRERGRDRSARGRHHGARRAARPRARRGPALARRRRRGSCPTTSTPAPRRSA